MFFKKNDWLKIFKNTQVPPFETVARRNRLFKWRLQHEMTAGLTATACRSQAPPLFSNGGCLSTLRPRVATAIWNGSCGLLPIRPLPFRKVRKITDNVIKFQKKEREGGEGTGGSGRSNKALSNLRLIQILCQLQLCMYFFRWHYK